MSKSDIRRAESSYGKQPQGIIVLDRVPLPAATQLRAFVWCRNRVDHATLEPGPAPESRRFTLMLGLPKAEGGNGDG